MGAGARHPLVPRLLLALGAAVAGCVDEGGLSKDGGNRARDAATADASTAAPDAGATAACLWTSGELPQLSPPMMQAKGVLRGMSRNASTTCTRQKGTGGPEALYLLRLEERLVVELEVTSNIDTVVAIRRACDDPLTELACSDGRAVPGATPAAPMPTTRDAGAPASGQPPPEPGSRDGLVRAALDPGVYFVLVDEAEPFGVGGEFTLNLRTSPPPAQASCRTPLPVMDGTSLAAEPLEVAADPAPACGGGERRPALYYAVTIPSGQRLTARALPSAGDRSWSPQLQLFPACDQRSCLATDRPSTQGDRELRYVNNGPQALQAILSVASSAPVSGAAVRLDVSIGDPTLNQTCASARPLSDGLVLRNQDLSEGQTSNDARCKSSVAPSLFYKATLYPNQRITASVTGRPDLAGRRPRLLFVSHDTCGMPSDQCAAVPGERFETTNTSPKPKTIYLEVSTFPGQAPGLFDLMVSMPLPPGGIEVRPTAGLITSESGDSASFEVVLTAPPTAAVTIPLESSIPEEGAVSPATLRFEPGNWDKPQKVTVTGVDDRQRDGTRPYTIRLAPAMSMDGRYAGVDGEDVSVTNLDDEAGFRFQAPTPLLTSEAGARATFTVVLSRQPTAPVRLGFASSDAGEATVMPAELVFDAASWRTPQTATVVGVDDNERDGPQAFKIVTSPGVSADPQYSGIDPEDLDGRNGDDEFETVRGQSINGTQRCPLNANPRIAVDEAGIIYVSMSCPGGTDPKVSPDDGEPRTWVTTSLDGGRTFAAARQVGREPAFELHMAGGGPGIAYLVEAGAPTGVAFLRTSDGGTRWSAPTLLLEQTANPRLAATARKVAITASTPDDTQYLWFSEDAGNTFKRFTLGKGAPVFAIGFDAQGALWTATWDGTLKLRRAADGVTFEGATTIAGDLSTDSLAVGRTSFFGSGDQGNLVVAPLGNASSARTVTGFSAETMFPRVLIPDAADNVTVLDSASNGFVVRRLDAKANVPGEPRLLGAIEGVPAGVALSNRAVAVTWLRDERVFVAVELWP